MHSGNQEAAMAFAKQQETIQINKNCIKTKT